MASIYKRNKRKKGEPYCIQYTDHTGKRHEKKGFTDRGLTEQLAWRLEEDVRKRKAGLIDPEEGRLAGIAAQDIDDHLKAFEASLSENTAKYVDQLLGRLRRLFEGVGAEILADIDAEEIETFLKEYVSQEDIGPRTYNHYLAAADTFCNWCVRSKRLTSNPLRGLERRNAQLDVRHPRRALKPKEFARLLAAENSAKSVQRYTGPMRARVYYLAYMTGLRKNELASLTPKSFDLAAVPPTLTVEAKVSKHRKKDVLPLHPELAKRLVEWTEGMKPTDKLFPKLGQKKAYFMIRYDLKTANIPYQTDEGIVDFHAAGRHTHITELLRNGVSLPEAMELARHSTVNMTMRYAHIGLDDQAAALANLPAPAAEPAAGAANPAGGLLHICCDPVGAACQLASPAVTSPGKENAASPCEEGTCGVDCHCMSVQDKVEAAGVEPASRDGSRNTSTCLAVSTWGRRRQHGGDPIPRPVNAERQANAGTVDP